MDVTIITALVIFNSVKNVSVCGDKITADTPFYTYIDYSKNKILLYSEFDINKSAIHGILVDWEKNDYMLLEEMWDRRKYICNAFVTGRSIEFPLKSDLKLKLKSVHVDDDSGISYISKDVIDNDSESIYVRVDHNSYIYSWPSINSLDLTVASDSIFDGLCWDNKNGMHVVSNFNKLRVTLLSLSSVDNVHVDELLDFNTIHISSKSVFSISDDCEINENPSYDEWIKDGIIKIIKN